MRTVTEINDQLFSKADEEKGTRFWLERPDKRQRQRLGNIGNGMALGKGLGLLLLHKV